MSSLKFWGLAPLWDSKKVRIQDVSSQGVETKRDILVTSDKIQVSLVPMSIAI